MSRRKRLQIEIDLMGLGTHLVQILPEVTIARLIQEILVEFGLDYPFLDQHRVQDYVLRISPTGYDLPADQRVRQIGGRRTLYFMEKEVVIPSTAVAVPTPFYLRYRSHVFKIGWQPAIIGRPEPGASQNELLAVNLEPFSLAVSRRQAEIIVENGRFAIRRLNENPTFLNGHLLPITIETPHQSPLVPLQDGDEILLRNSGIVMTCIQPPVYNRRLLTAPDRDSVSEAEGRE